MSDQDSTDCFSGGFGGDIPTQSKEDWNIYPIPTTSVIHCMVPNMTTLNTTFILYDIFGNRVKQGVLNGEENRINLCDLPSGIYLLQIDSDKNTMGKRKIIKL